MRMVGMFTTPSRVLRIAEEQYKQMVHAHTRAELTTHLLIDRSLPMEIAKFRIRSLSTALRWRFTKRRLLSAAMRKYLIHYRLTRVEVSIRIGPLEKTWTRCYGSASPTLSSALTFASSIISTRRLQLTVLKFFEHRGSATNVLLFKFRSDN